jgi:AAA domain
VVPAVARRRRLADPTVDVPGPESPDDVALFEDEAPPHPVFDPEVIAEVTAEIPSGNGHHDAISAAAGRVERVGLGYRMRFPDDVVLRVSRIRESGGEVTGELDVRRADEDLFLGRFNFSSVNARKTTAEYLSRRVKAEWQSMLEPLCRVVLRTEREGPGFESLGQRGVREPTRFRLQPILQDGKTTILFGPGGGSKSTLANGIAVSVTGLEVIPGWKPIAAPVVVLDWEDDRDTWSERTAAIAAGVGARPPTIYYRQMLRPLADDVEAVASFVSERKAGLVIVDSVGMAIGALGESASWHEGALRLFSALRILRTTVLGIDHVAGTELDASAPSPKMFGSVVKLNLARSVFELRKGRGNGTTAELLLHHTKVNTGRRLDDIGLTVEHSPGRIQFKRVEVQDMQAPELASRVPLATRMERLLQSGPQSRSDIAKALDAKAPDLRRVLFRDAGKRFREVSGLVELVKAHA